MENWFEWIPAYAVRPEAKTVNHVADMNNEGSQFRGDERQSPSFLRKQESRGNGHPTREANKKWRRQWKIELIEKSNPEYVDLYGELV